MPPQQETGLVEFDPVECNGTIQLLGSKKKRKERRKKKKETRSPNKKKADITGPDNRQRLTPGTPRPDRHQ
jgi:hypothetical protein